ncbi:lamin tail domain-containing protein [Parabacteroides johnsonii]|uniref:lamin tail domain-containing protein n=1 Tax=Parabacteroides johnsonii TaxID=387661 RepID=UPI003AB49D31
MKQFILFLFVLLPFCVNSQVNETFDGPTLGADWIGKDRGQFAINADGRLQLNIEPTESGTASIGKEIAYSSDMQWEFDVHMQKSPSDKNKLYVYLYQENDERFCYVHIGNVGYKELGLKHHGNTDLISPQTEFEAFPLLLHVKVTLEDHERWNLYYKTDEMTGYRSEGSALFATDESVGKGNLIFTFYYTKTLSDLFSIDNVRILNRVTETPLEPEIPDKPEILPNLIEVEPFSASNLLFSFDSPVDISDAVFNISTIGDAYTKSYVDTDTKRVVSTFFEKKMQTDCSYTISYTGLKSLSGKAMQDECLEVILQEEGSDPSPEPDPVPGRPDSYPKGSVVINEVMAKPGNGGMVEYVELRNMTSASVSLHKWEYKNVTGRKTKVLPSIDLPAGGYAVLLDDEEKLSVPAQAALILLEKFPALNDNGATLQLWDAAGNKIEEMTYDAATSGVSWELSEGRWLLSTAVSGGTPGAVNSNPQIEEKPEDPDDPDETPEGPEEPSVPDEFEPVLPGEIIINELLPDPYAGGSEYIELYNRSEHALSLSALSLAIRKSDGTLSTRYPLTSVPHNLKAKGYLLLTKNLEGVTSFYDIADLSALCELPKLPILANTSSTLALLRTADKIVIDEVAYSSKWHAHSVKNVKGVALERIDPDAATQDPANWTSASKTVGCGTPGYQNSQYKNASSGDATGIEPPVWIEESGSYTVSYLLDRPGYSCRAFVFNTSGLRVAEISNHELLGISGKIIWSGIANNGSPLQAGIYIFYAEIYHPEGMVKRFKKAFLIR